MQKMIVIPKGNYIVQKNASECRSCTSSDTAGALEFVRGQIPGANRSFRTPKNQKLKILNVPISLSLWFFARTNFFLLYGGQIQGVIFALQLITLSRTDGRTTTQKTNVFWEKKFKKSQKKNFFLKR